MKILKEYEAEVFLKKSGLPIIRHKLITNEKELLKAAELLEYPLVLKNPSELHKTEKNAVILNIYKDNLISSYKKLKTKKVLVQKQIEGLQLLIGIKKDPTFSHVLAFGSGGIYTEILKDVSFRVLPVTNKDVKEMISETKISKLLNYRNNKIDAKKLESILLKISNLVKKYPKIKELDINPLIVNNKELVIADARIIFE
ncbi:MAG: acetate--CoA ligase family protein [Nanoarchaeota archaeon]|nr:acetate--CoA ligase family protein [Nanoarchaeota archaeon]